MQCDCLPCTSSHSSTKKIIHQYRYFICGSCGGLLSQISDDSGYQGQTRALFLHRCKCHVSIILTLSDSRSFEVVFFSAARTCKSDGRGREWICTPLVSRENNCGASVGAHHAIGAQDADGRTSVTNCLHGILYLVKAACEQRTRGSMTSSNWHRCYRMHTRAPVCWNMWGCTFR